MSFPTIQEYVYHQMTLDGSVEILNTNYNHHETPATVAKAEADSHLSHVLSLDKLRALRKELAMISEGTKMELMELMMNTDIACSKPKNKDGKDENT